MFTFIEDQLSGMLTAILDYTSNKNFTIQDKNDILFFSKAMETSSKLRNKELLYRLHQFLLTGNNYNLIGDGFSESVY